VIPALSVQTQDPNIHNWVLSALLPWVYWHQQTQKTRQPQLKQRYQQAAQRVQARFLAVPFTQRPYTTQNSNSGLIGLSGCVPSSRVLPLPLKVVMVIYPVSISQF